MKCSTCPNEATRTGVYLPGQQHPFGTKRHDIGLCSNGYCGSAVRAMQRQQDYHWDHYRPGVGTARASRGLFQFIPQTFEAAERRYGERFGEPSQETLKQAYDNYVRSIVAGADMPTNEHDAKVRYCIERQLKRGTGAGAGWQQIGGSWYLAPDADKRAQDKAAQFRTQQPEYNFRVVKRTESTEVLPEPAKWVRHSTYKWNAYGLSLDQLRDSAEWSCVHAFSDGSALIVTEAESWEYVTAAQRATYTELPPF